MKNPLVSCIMPTYNRQKFIVDALNGYLNQDYKNKELIIIDDSEDSIEKLVPKCSSIKYIRLKNRCPIGYKRNLACKNSQGEIILHLDDDDKYSDDWVTKQVKCLLEGEADICGLRKINFLCKNFEVTWTYEDDDTSKPWVYGATLCYRKSFWLKHQFEDMQTGEDNAFVLNNNAKIISNNYSDGYLGIIHDDNIGLKINDDLKDKLQVLKWIKKIDKPELTYVYKDIKTLKNTPLVTCIMPTANRQKYIPNAIKNFLQQNYSNLELVIIDDGEQSSKGLVPTQSNIHYTFYNTKHSIGEKRNLACNVSNGEIIMHWDDDDWYAPDWVTVQVANLLDSDAHICGLNQIQFYSIIDNIYWMSKNYNSKRPWLSGATLCYYKSFWASHKFQNIQVGEDDAFVRSAGTKVTNHNYYQGFISLIHNRNTSIKEFQ